MKERHAITHDLSRDIQNVMSLLKFIDVDEDIKDPEIKSMLKLAINRESAIFASLKALTEGEKGHL
jgi:hypothetical protein